MKVYLGIAGCHSGQHVAEVFSSRESAEKWREQAAKIEEASIDEREVDSWEFQEPVTIYHAEISLFKGTVEASIRNRKIWKDEVHIWVTNVYDFDWEKRYFESNGYAHVEFYALTEADAISGVITAFKTLTGMDVSKDTFLTIEES